MFELFVVACVAYRACEYVVVPMRYQDEARCFQQAALIAGMARGRHPAAGSSLTYEATCRPAATAWLAQSADAPVHHQGAAQ